MREIDIAPGRSSDEYAVSVVNTSRKAQREHGAQIARSLGWPKYRTGLVGAFGSLIDLGAPVYTPRSMTWIVRLHRDEANRIVRENMRREIHERTPHQ